MKVLGIETSCDETGVAVYQEGTGIVWEALYSQIALHREYGGVVPELASRDHVRRLAPMVERALAEAGAPDAVAWTAGPGLIGALLVGASLGTAFAAARALPALAVNHLEGHLLAPLMGEDAPEFPFVVLLVSGGHTLLVEARALGAYRLLGTTLDDAAGEAFDKTASLLGLPYPGGPELARLAATGRAGGFDLPRPLLNRPGCDFSFSGLKTAVLYAARKQDGGDDGWRADLARDFEEAVVEVLCEKSRRALEATGHGELVVAGGVAANARLREGLGRMAERQGVRVIFPAPGLCTDNGAMIAHAGWRRLAAGERPQPAKVRARWPLDELQSPGK
ncbi:MAG: tRNA (adenosine(37)-N6)-threonylcarbamoyltransferase complex transferase subunit TsaD [Gammaproteobacteria bacterium]|nr:tRNA (adenosine(37)-N6)-threonylcarbamoyltransferase complex transferase subunit TsaD [Gammaproteobacteria bacterium]